MHAKTVKKNNVHLHAVVGRAINKLFHGIEKYKIRSCIIYLTENQVSSPSIHGGQKLRINFYRALTMQTIHIIGPWSGLDSMLMGSKKRAQLK